MQYQSTLQQKIANTAAFFENAKKLSEQVEKQLLQNASNLKEAKTKKTSFLDEHGDVLKFTHRFHTTIKKDRGLMDYVNNGVCAGYFARFDIAKLHVDKKMKYLQAGGELSVGTVQGNVDAKLSLFENKKIDPSLQLEVSASATLAQVGVYANVGNSYLSTRGEADVKVGCASAGAKAVISKDEITLKAHANAAALRGEVKGVFSIFGVKITASASGSIGSVGAEAAFSSKKGEFEVGTSVSLLAGVGLNIRVNY